MGKPFESESVSESESGTVKEPYEMNDNVDLDNTNHHLKKLLF